MICVYTIYAGDIGKLYYFFLRQAVRQHKCYLRQAVGEKAAAIANVTGSPWIFLDSRRGSRATPYHDIQQNTII